MSQISFKLYKSLCQLFKNEGRSSVMSVLNVSSSTESTTHIFTQPIASTAPQDKYTNTTWISTPRQEYITFQVKTCKEASIALSDSVVSRSSSSALLLCHSILQGRNFGNGYENLDKKTRNKCLKSRKTQEMNSVVMEKCQTQKSFFHLFTLRDE